MKTGIKSVFSLLLCALVLLLPVAALAAGEDFALDDYIGPGVGVGYTLLVVASAIILDTILGILHSIGAKEFDPRKLPQFFLTGVLPFIGGLFLLAVLAYFFDVPFGGMFYAAAATIVAKYITDIWDKLKLLFGVKLVE